jgi:hypothetical protein
MDKWNLFISYKWESKELVHQICDDLEKAGFIVWIDRHEVIPGQSIYVKIKKGINNSEIVMSSKIHNSQILFILILSSRNIIC